MKKLLALFTLVMPLWLFASSEKPFVVVIPSSNNKNWYKQNLASVFDQRYQNYRIIYVADAPTDGTVELVENYVRENEQEHRFTLIVNKERNGPLACMCQAVFSCEKHEIVVDLDGNDWLAHDNVLSYLNAIYADADVWMTYGQFLYYPQFNKGFAEQIPLEVFEKNSIRSFRGALTHLKTFYAGLFQEIDKDDFFWEGRFISKATDLAYSLPLIEMSGKHSRFIPEILYVYNNTRPLNDHKAYSDLEERMDNYIRSKEKYLPLALLPHLNKKDPPFNVVYSKIKDIYHPTIQDYRLIQDYISHGQRDNLERLGHMESVVRDMKYIGNSPEEFPRSGIIPVNCDLSEKENCLLIYCTFNRNYPNALKRLIDLVTASDYRGHIFYRLGGWPNTEGGSLNLSHVPYAFKSSFFKEAQHLGYKRVLWLDTAVVPLVSLNDIFEMIDDKNYFIMGNGHMIGPYMNPQAAAYFGLTLRQTFNIPSCSAGLFGVDLTKEVGRKIIDIWYRAAHDKDALYSPRSDQNALSIILNQLQLTDFTPISRMPHSKSEITYDSLFLLDREFAYWGIVN